MHKDDGGPAFPAHEHHLKTVGEVTIEHAAAILANGARAALHGLAGENPDHRLIALAAFLFHLCQVKPARRDKMHAILTTVRDEVCAASPLAARKQEATRDAG